MIRLDNSHRPTQATLDELSAWQGEIIGTHPERVERADSLWSQKNTKSNPTFKSVKTTLAQMCSGARRCFYCEDSVADEIDHFWPKSLYPSKVFDWDNFNYACSNCNRPKWRHFAVFHPVDRSEYDLAVHDSAREGPDGDPILLNPRTDDPMEYAILDLLGTFKFYAKPGISAEHQRRFEFTYQKVLKLNHEDREPLRQGRMEAFADFKNAIFALSSKAQAGNAEAELDRILTEILAHRHPTVLKEIIRYFDHGWLATVDEEMNHQLHYLLPRFPKLRGKSTDSQ
jgi:uncharacterized protein (TIGR02646 family)